MKLLLSVIHRHLLLSILAILLGVVLPLATWASNQQCATGQCGEPDEPDAADTDACTNPGDITLGGGNGSGGPSGTPCPTCPDDGSNTGPSGNSSNDMTPFKAWLNANYPKTPVMRAGIVEWQYDTPLPAPEVLMQQYNAHVESLAGAATDVTGDLVLELSLGSSSSGASAGSLAVNLELSDLSISRVISTAATSEMLGQCLWGTYSPGRSAKVYIAGDVVVRVIGDSVIEMWPRSSFQEWELSPTEDDAPIFTSDAFQPMICSLTVSDLPNNGGRSISGFTPAGPYQATFSTASSSELTISEVIENGTKKVISENNSFTPYRIVERFKAHATEAETWVPVGKEVTHYKTLSDGTRVMTEKRVFVHQGEELVTQYEYEEELAYGITANLAFGKLKAQYNPDGSWVKYEYGLDGSLWRELRPWAQYPNDPVNATPENCWCRVTIGANSDLTLEDDGEWNWSSERIFINGILTEHKIIDGVDTAAGRDVIERTRQHRLDAAGNPETYFTTRTWFYEIDDTTLTRKLRYRTDEAGVMTAVKRKVYGTIGGVSQLFQGGQGTTHHASITTGPLDIEGMTVPGRTLRKFDVKDLAGRVVLQYSMVATSAALPDAATYGLLDGERTAYGSLGRITSKVSLIGNITLESTVYDDAAGTRTVTDRSGTVTTHVTDPDTGVYLGYTRHAVPADSVKGIPAVPALTESRALAYNDYGLVAETTVRSSGTPGQPGYLSTSRTLVRDASGRPVLSIDEQGRQTSHEYWHQPDNNFGGRVNVTRTIKPGGDHEMVLKWPDGQLRANETSTPPVSYNRDVRTDGSIEELALDGWGNRTRRKLFGTFKTLLIDEKGTADNWGQNYVSTSGQRYHHDYAGRPVRNIRTGEQGAPSSELATTLTEYDSLGQVRAQGTDMNGNGTLDRAGTDIITETQRDFQESDGSWWAVTQEKRYITPGSSTNFLLTESWVKLAAANAVTRQIRADGSILTTVTTVDRPAGLTTVSSTVTRDGVEAESTTRKTVAGLLVAETLLCCPELITHEYDGLGRRVATDHPEKGRSETQYNALGQIEWTQNALGEPGRTRYTYYAANHLSAGRIHIATAPGGATTIYEYDTKGRITAELGTGGYPIRKEYNNWGQLEKLYTYRDAGVAQPVPAVTTWEYHDDTGLLYKKTDDLERQTVYNFTEGGQLYSRTWARKDANDADLTTTYAYNAAGQLTDIDYSDSTPDVHYELDRLGRQTEITDASGTRTLTRDGPGGELGAVSYDDEGLLPDLIVNYGHDTKGRKNSLTVTQGSTTLSATSYGHVGATEKLQSVTHDGATATYDWGIDVLGLPGSVTYGGVGLKGTRTPDEAGRLEKIEWTITSQNNAIISSHTYELDGAGKREAATREDGTVWDYGYNSKGEVTSAVHKNAADEALPGRSFGYEFDDIGNRKTAETTALNGDVQATSYAANDLNQYETITRPNPLRRLIQGLANEQANIEVFMHTHPPNPPAPGANQTAQATSLSWPGGVTPSSLTIVRIPLGGVPFYTEAALDTSTGPVWRYIVVRATRPGAGVNAQNLATLRQGWLYFPPTSETLQYDEDGNLTADARWTYQWDAENRLIQMTEHARTDGPARQRLTFTYDSQSRRARKVVESFSSSVWTTTQDLRFLYDDWNLVAELNLKPETSNLELLRSYAWGLDLSGSEQGAGGVGGLLLAKNYGSSGLVSGSLASAVLAPTYDGNGNVTSYLDLSTARITSRHEYDAFGNELSEQSVLTINAGNSVPAFRFSTKYADAETGLLYYGYRYLSSEIGRWISRDPIGEEGGYSLYVAVGNRLPNTVDLLGQFDFGEDEANRRRGNGPLGDSAQHCWLACMWGLPSAPPGLGTLAALGGDYGELDDGMKNDAWNDIYWQHYGAFWAECPIVKLGAIWRAETPSQTCDRICETWPKM